MLAHPNRKIEAHVGEIRGSGNADPREPQRYHPAQDRDIGCSKEAREMRHCYDTKNNADREEIRPAAQAWRAANVPTVVYKDDEEGNIKNERGAQNIAGNIHAEERHREHSIGGKSEEREKIS